MSMRPIYSILLFFLSLGFVKGQDFSIVDSKAIKMYQKGEELTLSRRYYDAIESYEAAIKREASFLEAYVKASQLYITLGDLDNAERVALAGERRLAGKNARVNNVADYGWLFANIYLKRGEFGKAYERFEQVDPLFDESFRGSVYYRDMKSQMDFLSKQLGSSMAIEKEMLPEPLNLFKLQYFPVLTADGKQI